MVSDRFFGELIKRARLDIGFKLFIPCLRIELGIPTTKLAELFLRQRGDFTLELFDLRHA